MFHIRIFGFKNVKSQLFNKNKGFECSVFFIELGDNTKNHLAELKTKHQTLSVRLMTHF